jgi:serine/threonine-protein kinase SRPK3
MASASPPQGPSPPIKKSRIGRSPHLFPTSGFEVIEPSLQVEEEKLPTYDRTNYYPMRIGDIVDGHYQVVAKLGYGGTSTVWLARDLKYK